MRKTFEEDNICLEIYGKYLSRKIEDEYLTYNLDSKKCRIAKREHYSNHTYVVFNTSTKKHYQKSDLKIINHPFSNKT